MLAFVLPINRSKSLPRSPSLSPSLNPEPPSPPLAFSLLLLLALLTRLTSQAPRSPLILVDPALRRLGNFLRAPLTVTFGVLGQLKYAQIAWVLGLGCLA